MRRRIAVVFLFLGIFSLLGTGMAVADRGGHGHHPPPPTTTSIRPTTTTIQTTTSTVSTTTTTVPPTTTSTTIPSTCPGGIAIAAGTDLRAAVNNAPSGTKFCLAPGDYPSSASVLMKSSDQLVGLGAVLDFAGATLDSGYCVYGYGGSNGQSNVTISGVRVQNCAGYGIKEGDNWSVSSVTSTLNQVGLDGGCDNCTITHNSVYGITGAKVVSNTELGWNGGTLDSGGSTGGSKTVQLANSSWSNDYVHDNAGPGIWCDGCLQGSSFTVTGSRIEHNLDAGVDLEISYGGTVSNTTFKDNAYNTIGQSCWFGADIRVADSPGVSISGNTIDASAGEDAICTIDSNRTDGPALVTPFSAVNNMITLGTSSLIGEAGNGTGSDTFTPSNYLFSDTIYNSTAGNHWTLNSNNPLTFAQWQALGQDPSCVAIASGGDIQAAVNANPTDTTFCLSGMYTTSGINPKASDSFLGPATLDGGSVGTTVINGNNVNNVTVKNLTIEHYANGPGLSVLGWQNVGSGWDIENNEVAFNATEGIRVGPNAIVKNNHVHNNGQLGISGYQSDNALVSGNEIDHNGASTYTTNEGGGLKFYQGTNVTVSGNNVHDNIGTGIWLDTDVTTSTVSGNTVTNNGDPSNSSYGIEIEITCNVQVNNNTITSSGNETNAVMISSSHDVTVSGNTSSGTVNGIRLWEDNTRSTQAVCGAPTINNDHVTGNTTTLAAGSNHVVGVYVYKGTTAPTGTSFNSNIYHFSDCGVGHFQWFVSGNANYSYAQWQGLGQDISGSSCDSPGTTIAITSANFPTKFGTCATIVDSSHLRFDLTNSCNPGNDGHYRTDWSTVNTLFAAGTTSCVSVPIDFPNGVGTIASGSWWQFAEAKIPASSYADWGLYVTDNFGALTFDLHMSHYNNQASDWHGGDPTAGWNEFVVCSNYATDSSGFLTLYLNGTQVFNVSGIPILVGQTGDSLDLNDYTGGTPVPNTEIHYAPIVGPTFASVHQLAS